MCPSRSRTSYNAGFQVCHPCLFVQCILTRFKNCCPYLQCHTQVWGTAGGRRWHGVTEGEGWLWPCHCVYQNTVWRCRESEEGEEAPHRWSRDSKQLQMMTMNIWVQCWPEVSPEPGFHLSHFTELLIPKIQQLYPRKNMPFTILKSPSALVIRNSLNFPIPITKNRKKKKNPKPKKSQNFTCCN